MSDEKKDLKKLEHLIEDTPEGLGSDYTQSKPSQKSLSEYPERSGGFWRVFRVFPGKSKHRNNKNNR